jgi:large subunit ribosomal protein L19
MNVRFIKEEAIMDKIQAFTNEQLKTTPPEFQIGDSVRVYNKIKEGARERIQIFEGTVIARSGGGLTETFTVRHIAYGVGVEKIFPIHSPFVEKVRTSFGRR